MSDCCTPFLSQVEPSTSAFYGLFAPFEASSTKEFISYNLPQSQPLVTVPISVQKLSNNLGLAGVYISNTVDSTPLVGLTFTPTTFSTSSVTGLISGNVDSAHYYLNFVIFVKGT